VLLRHGATVNEAMPIADWSGSHHLSRLHQHLGHQEEEAMMMMEHGYVMNSEPANGASPLHAAVERGYVAFLKQSCLSASLWYVCRCMFSYYRVIVNSSSFSSSPTSVLCIKNIKH